jgi:hypothetical protein
MVCVFVLNRLLRKISVVPLAAESLGVRSMCTLVKTPDVRVLLDAGVSLGPNRFGFPPHPREYKALRKCRKKIEETAAQAKVVTISHYHFDHHTPSFTDWFCNWCSSETAEKIYAGKIVLKKDYRSKINFSQRRRGWLFTRTAGKHATRLEKADGKLFRFAETEIEFSQPVFHGVRDSALGWVLMSVIRYEDERVMFASDVQGPMNDLALQIILDETPSLLIVGGPPVYLADFKVSEEDLQHGFRNLEKIVKRVETTILDHHLLRDQKWRRYCRRIFETASETRHRVVTAAEFLGEKNMLLESQRKELFEAEPPSQEFEKWTKLPRLKKMRTKPPLG